jgi:hypothetical protein
LEKHRNTTLLKTNVVPLSVYWFILGLYHQLQTDNQFRNKIDYPINKQSKPRKKARSGENVAARWTTLDLR